MYAVLGLPIPTKLFARGADPIGSFGLVWCGLTNPYHNSSIRGTTHWLFWFGLDLITNPYHAADLGAGPPSETFTNHRLRTEDITHSDDTMCYVGL